MNEESGFLIPRMTLFRSLNFHSYHSSAVASGEE